MKQEALKNFDITWLPVTALVIFVLCFAGYALWAYRKQNRPFFEEASKMPLEDGTLKITRKQI